MNVTALVLAAILAQSTNSSPSLDGKAKAQVLLSEGAKLFEKGAMTEALEKFNQAYEEFPSPKLLFNIGQTSRNLGRAVEAMKAFERFLAEANDPPADMTAEAKRSMAQLRPVVGRLSVECSTPGAEIELDGMNVGFAPLMNSLWLMPGNHLVTARHPSYTPASVTVDINAGMVHAVVIPMQLRPKVSATRVPLGRSAFAGDKTSSSTSASPSNSSGDGDTGWWLGRKWAWVATAGAVVFTGTAVGFGLSMKSKFNSLNGSCGSAGADYPGCSSSDIDGVAFRRNMANVFWGLSAAAAVTAGVLFIVEGHSVSVTPVAGESIGFVAHTSY